MKNALIPGSFDPITCGHIDVIRKASAIFDSVVVAVLYNASKSVSMFTPEQRVELIECSLNAAGLNNVKVISFDGLTTDVAEKYNCQWIVKGARNAVDFDYELSLSVITKKFSQNLETIIIPTSPEYSHISSTYIRERIKYGKFDSEDFAPGTVDLIKKFVR